VNTAAHTRDSVHRVPCGSRLFKALSIVASRALMEGRPGDVSSCVTSCFAHKGSYAAMSYLDCSCALLPCMTLKVATSESVSALDRWMVLQWAVSVNSSTRSNRSEYNSKRLTSLVHATCRVRFLFHLVASFGSDVSNAACVSE
jgi:hypothetical protein